MKPLSAREHTVLTLSADGYSNKRIGAALDITEATVKVHKKSVLKKMDAANTAHAVAIGLRSGILPGVADAANASFERD